MIIVVAIAACSGDGPATPTSKPPTPTTVPASVSTTTAPTVGVTPAMVEAIAVAPVAWSDCGGGFDCGAVVVPEDYARPAGATIRLPLIRLRTSGSDRIGSLITNPGGPGASGITFVRRAAKSFFTDSEFRAFGVMLQLQQLTSCSSGEYA